MNQPLRDGSTRLFEPPAEAPTAPQSPDTGDDGSADVNARLAAIVDSSDDAIISKTLEGVITSWNRGAERIFGYTAEEAIGRSVLFLIPPERHGEETVILSRLSRGERIDHYETQRLSKDGRLLDVSLTVSPLRDRTGRVVGASKIARDITERQRLDRALKDLNAALEARVAERTAAAEAQAARVRELAAQLDQAEQRERRKLGALLHDELAQALALSKLKLTMYAAQPASARDDAQLASVKESLNTAIEFTRALMNDLSPPMLFDMGFSAAVSELAGRIEKEHGLKVRLSATGKVPLPETLRTFLFQAVREMLINVVKYASTDRASVTIQKTPAEVSVVVQDEGGGFNLDKLPSRPGEKGGFGLYSIRERAALLGGTFRIESEPGKGTRCYLWVPVSGRVLAPPGVVTPSGSV